MAERFKFFKATNREHPKHGLPSVLWDNKGEKAVFEFSRGQSGLLEFETEDPKVVKIMRDMGYDEQPLAELGTVPAAVKVQEA